MSIKLKSNDNQEFELSPEACNISRYLQTKLKEEKKLLSCVFLYLKYENIIAINANESLDNYRSYHFNT